RLRRPCGKEVVRRWRASPANAAPPPSRMAAAGGRPTKEMANMAAKLCIGFMSGCQRQAQDFRDAFC
ncbi:MAG TPA: hypothetical protein VN729_13660, partial [Ktedonobacteraceae bacterium]|nr:hypothetical protein [Ktedonobacteraceae bacterium]